MERNQLMVPQLAQFSVVSTEHRVGFGVKRSGNAVDTKKTHGASNQPKIDFRTGMCIQCKRKKQIKEN